jgi:hypothetical protein
MADFMAVYGSPLLEDAASVHVVMISEQLFMISAGNFSLSPPPSYRADTQRVLRYILYIRT